MAEFLPPTTEQTIGYLESEVERLRDQLSRLREETNDRIFGLVSDYEAADEALTQCRERHAADARDLNQLRVTVRDESARAHAAEVEIDALRAEVERLNGWMQKIEGGDTPCKDESRLRQWAYEALILRRQPE